MINEFGSNLRKYREAKEMSQEQLACILGTSKQVISRYENEQRSPKVSTVAEYAEKLNIPMSELTGYNEPKEKPANNSELSQIKKDFITLIDTLDDQQVARVMELVQTALRLGEK